MLHHDRCMINIHKKIHQKIKRNKKHTIVHFLIVSNLSTRKQLFFLTFSLEFRDKNQLTYIEMMEKFLKGVS